MPLRLPVVGAANIRYVGMTNMGQANIGGRMSTVPDAAEAEAGQPQLAAGPEPAMEITR